MYVITARNVNHAYLSGAALLRTHGVRESSRAGEVLVVPEPVTTHYQYPRERVLYDELRDANPFFHLFEALWMLAGRDDVAYPAQFNRRFVQYSDDGVTQHAAYGHRWRVRLDVDQLDELVQLLVRDPTTRRAVLQMWHAPLDLNKTGADFPCNIGAHFQVREGKLCLTVFNRSNDMIWGAYGANAVHMSYLLEYVAGRVGLPVGWYEQVSSNFHAYLPVYLEKRLDQPWLVATHCPYETYAVAPYGPLMRQPEAWDADLKLFLAAGKGGLTHYQNPFFAEVAEPLMRAWRAWSTSRNKSAALEHLEDCEALDWRLAARQWLLRRKAARQTISD